MKSTNSTIIVGIIGFKSWVGRGVMAGVMGSLGGLVGYKLTVRFELGVGLPDTMNQNGGISDANINPDHNHV